MEAPVWEYVVLCVLFSFGFIAGIFGLVGIAFAKDPIYTDGKSVTHLQVFFRILFGGFAGYLSWQLFQWYGGPLGVVILAAHWASMASSFLTTLAYSGKKVLCRASSVIWGMIYTTSMLVALIIYGVTCL